MAGWVSMIQEQLDAWSQQQKDRQLWRAWHWKWKWPWQGHNGKDQKQLLKEEYQRRAQQVQSLCKALKVDNLAELQDLFGAMILSECIYKKPESDLVRAVNKFKTDFGGQLVALERVQVSLEHVPHRYLLAEAGNTLFASFVGTNHYKDVITDVNLFQGDVFNEDMYLEVIDNDNGEASPGKQSDAGTVKGLGTTLDPQPKTKARIQSGPRPAAHRGFLGRAKGIPAVELYRLAQKKGRNLVLCGHSLGGAVAALTTLAILRVFASSPILGSKLNIKCITFSQPPVGNRALRDYVHQQGWQNHFHTYCIPEDIVPRLLSPAYFQHYQVRTNDSAGQTETSVQAANDPNSTRIEKNAKDERMALGVGPVQSPFWRISRLVPLAGVPRPLQWFRGATQSAEEQDLTAGPKAEDESLAGSLEIQENADRVSLVPLLPGPESSSEPAKSASAPLSGKKEPKSGVSDWRPRVPALPSYIPFGQLFLLEKSEVEPLSASEYTRLTSVQSVLLELRDRFQSHTMKSYRSRFQKIHDFCIKPELPAPAFIVEQLPHLPHLQEWLGMSGIVEAGKITDPLVIRSATSLVPLGWSGTPGEKKGSEQLKVDIQGYGLHLCTLVRAKVNGRWCSTTIVSIPPNLPSIEMAETRLQKMRISIGAPIQKAQQLNLEANGSIADSSGLDQHVGGINLGDSIEGVGEVTVYCSTDFTHSTKNVALRMRRVRLMGLEGAGKTSLYYALLGQAGGTTFNSDAIFPDMEWREGVAGGINYVDAVGVNLQDLNHEKEQLRQELALSVGGRGKKIDLVVLVHNLAQKIPRLRQTGGTSGAIPALSILVDEVVTTGIPHVLAITNKFSVSADHRHRASAAVMEAYKVSPSLTAVVNSCPYIVKGHASVEDLSASNESSSSAKTQGTMQKIMYTPVNLVQMPFRRKVDVLPIEGVKNLRSLIHRILLSCEETAFEELARQALDVGEHKQTKQSPKGHLLGYGKYGGGATAAIGAAIGASFGVFLALFMGATSALQKP